ncbi:MAG: N-acetylmannosamine-6-phosphate 2-epimerase [Cyanobium sp.]
MTRPSLTDWSPLKGSLIVSVQAPEGSPLRHPLAIAAMAEACLANGASGVRLESPEHIAAVRLRCPNALIVGLWKRTWAESSVYITPRWEDLQAVWAAGADVVALDATLRPRPEGVLLDDLVRRAREDLGVPLMADVDSLDSGVHAAELGCAWVGTTLYGYTEATKGFIPPAFALLSELRRALPAAVPVVCEGGIGTPEQALQALNGGADFVVVGTAITGVDLQVARYVKTLNEGSQIFL